EDAIRDDLVREFRRVLFRARRSREPHAPRGEPRGRPARERLEGRGRGRPLAPRERRRSVIEIQRARIDVEAVVDSARRDDAGAKIGGASCREGGEVGGGGGV